MGFGSGAVPWKMKYSEPTVYIRVQSALSSTNANSEFGLATSLLKRHFFYFSKEKAPVCRAPPKKNSLKEVLKDLSQTKIMLN